MRSQKAAGGIEDPLEALNDMHTKELGAFDLFHSLQVTDIVQISECFFS